MILLALSLEWRILSLETQVFLDCLIIFAARVADVSLGTLRTAAVVQGRRSSAWIFAFIGMLIWILVVADVMKNLDKPAYMFAFAFGFATGTSVGMYLENWLAQGSRVIRIFTRFGKEMADRLRENGFITTTFQGEGRDGPTQLLFIEARRRDREKIESIAKEIDDKAYFIFSSANSLH